MKRILNLVLALALFLTLIPTSLVYAEEEETDYATGLIWDSQEIIDEHLREIEPPAFEEALPASVDMADKFPIPGNQGSQNSCAAWAVAYALRSHQEEFKQNWGLDTNEHLFSPSYVYNQCNNGKDKGMSTYEAMELITEQGVCTLASFPYKASDYLTQPTDEQRTEAAKYKTDDWYIVSGINSMKRRLAEGDGVIISFVVFPDFRDLSKSNPIYDTSDGKASGSHAVCLIGYDDEMNAFKFINSWGTNWGINGYGWISYDILSNQSVNLYGEPTGYIMEPSGSVFTSDFYEYTIYNDEAKIISYSGEGGEVEIPDTLDGYSVTRIGDNAFKGRLNITGVIIPDSVTEIGSGAFENCTITGITIPDSVTEIGDRAFFGCNQMTDISLGKGLTIISPSAFCYCSAITDITIPDNVTIIGEKAFAYCSQLKNIAIGSGVTEIGKKAFMQCNALTDITIPGNINIIGDYAFSKCEKLVNVNFGNGITKIGNYAFQGCKALTEAIIPDSATVIGDYAFENCQVLNKAVIGDGVMTIGEKAFYKCYSLADLTLGSGAAAIGNSAFEHCAALNGTIEFDNITKIGNCAFQFCEGISGVVIGSSIVNIGDKAFYGCGLTDISVDENNQYYTDIDGVLYDKQLTTAIQCPKRKTGSHTIPDSVRVISAHAFENCDELSELKVGSGMRDIGDYAFAYCKALTEVKIPDGTPSIGNDAFAGTSLTEVVIPDSVTVIGNWAFSGCMDLTSAVIPESVTEIGWGAFSYIGGVGEPIFFPLPKLTVYCVKNSYAHEYAVEWELPVVLRGGNNTKMIKVSSLPNSGNIEVNHIKAVKSDNGSYDFTVDCEQAEDIQFFLAIYSGNILTKVYTADSNVEITGVAETDLPSAKILIWDKNMQPCIEAISDISNHFNAP